MKKLIAITALMLSLLLFRKEITKSIGSTDEPAPGNTTKKFSHLDTTWNDRDPDTCWIVYLSTH